LRSFLRSAQVAFVVVLAGVLSLSLTGCGGSSTPVITHPTLTITAADASRGYGDPNPVFTASASGALSGDTFTLTASTVATPSSPAGAYSIVPLATGANLANYNVVYVNGTLAVSLALLTVTPYNQSIVAGSALPSLSATITGFVNGDTQAVVTGSPGLATTANSSSPAGSYPIYATFGTLSAANYAFTLGRGTLTILPASNPGVGFTGRAMAGKEPVVEATVQVYAAGTTGNGSVGTALLGTTLTTDAAGAFTVPAGYACPAAASQLYVIVRGGQAGTAAVNPAITLATPIGVCNQPASGLPFVINEVTTAATAYGLAQFLSPGGNIGATATNTKGLSNAVATVASLANLTTGTSPGSSFPPNGSSPAAKINSIANLLNTCTSATSASGCTALFSATTPGSGTAPSNTLDAALNLVLNPGSNVAALYTQSTASTAFTPALTAAPSDWTMFINYTGGGMNTPTAVGVDATGNVWVASYNSAASEFSPAGTPIFPNGITSGGLFHSYGLAIDAQNDVWIPNEDSTNTGANGGNGSVTVLSSTGQLVSGATGFTTGGLAYPIAVAIDTNATAWVIDYLNQHLSLLSSTGQPLSGSTGYSSPELQFPVSLAIDASNNAWLGNSYGGAVVKVSPNGSQVTFTSYACCNWAGGIAIDQRGYVWVANYMGDSISQLAGDGTVVSKGYSDNKASISHPQGIAVDGSGHVWVTNILGSSITELAGSATNSPGQILSPTPGWAKDAGLNNGWAVAIDASGNLWVVNHTTNILTEIVGLATPVKTPQIGPVRSP
jgi:sugar lactone lactonase YvrE